MACPKCHSPMVSDGEKMLCANIQCEYQYDLAKKLPTYDDLIKNYNLVRKALQDIVECHGNRDELINKARILLQNL